MMPAFASRVLCAASVTAAELLKVFDERRSFGIMDGVWYVLHSEAPIASASQEACLCARFGLSQDDLLELMSAVPLTLKSTAASYGLRMAEAGFSRVVITKGSTIMPGSMTPQRIQCETRHAYADPQHSTCDTRTPTLTDIPTARL